MRLIGVIPLTKGYVTTVDQSDYFTLVGFSWYALKVQRRVYAARSEKVDGEKRIVLMHRQIMGEPEKRDVDHRDGDGLNNRRENLRVATRQQNLQAFQRKPFRVTSIFRGVSWHAQIGRWRATLKLNRRQISLGCYKDELAAAMAYDKGAKEHFGEFACPNFKQ